MQTYIGSGDRFNPHGGFDWGDQGTKSMPAVGLGLVHVSQMKVKRDGAVRFRRSLLVGVFPEVSSLVPLDRRMMSYCACED